MSFKTIAIIGVGLIGSSLARAVKSHELCETCHLFDVSDTVRKELEPLKIGKVCTTLADAVRQAELIILCTPVGQLSDMVRALEDLAPKGAIITDVGSVKHSLVKNISTKAKDRFHIIPGHPIAGTEKSGPAAGFAELFEDRWHLLTPLKDQGEDYDHAIDKLSDFWRALGAKVELMEASHHDLVLAMTSHIPHLIAFNIVATASDIENVTKSEVVKYSGGGFRDFTRIAASDPTMWRDVFLHNKEAVLEILGRFSEDLSALQRAIRWEDGEALYNHIDRARGIRKRIIEAGEDTDAVNFGREH